MATSGDTTTAQQFSGACERCGARFEGDLAKFSSEGWKRFGRSNQLGGYFWRFVCGDCFEKYGAKK